VYRLIQPTMSVAFEILVDYSILVCAHNSCADILPITTVKWPKTAEYSADEMECSIAGQAIWRREIQSGLKISCYV